MSRLRSRIFDMSAGRREIAANRHVSQALKDGVGRMCMLRPATTLAKQERLLSGRDGAHLLTSMNECCEWLIRVKVVWPLQSRRHRDHGVCL